MQTREAIDQVLWDVFVTACEGGINYWGWVNDYRIWKDGETFTHDLRGFNCNLVIEEFDGDETTSRQVVLNKRVILRGLHRMADARGPYYDPNGKNTNCISVPYLGQWHHDIAVGLLDQPTLEREWDASFADSVVQVGLFGEVRYG